VGTRSKHTQTTKSRDFLLFGYIKVVEVVCFCQIEAYGIANSHIP